MANTQTINLTVDGQVYNSTLGDAYDYASGWGDVSLTRRLLGLASAPAVAGDVTVRVSGALLVSVRPVMAPLFPWAWRVPSLAYGDAPKM